MPRVRPILFSGPMVRALLDGRKTQTRRVLKPQPPKDEYGDDYITRLNGPEWYEPAVVDKYGDEVPGKPIWGVYDELGEWGAPVPYMPGDLLWVRERWSDELLAPGEVYYYATALEDGLRADEVAEIRWRPSIHMPRWASRITLEVTDVRVQRLQEITDEDALAEGVTKVREHCYVIRGIDYDEIGHCHSCPIARFAKLWDSLNAKRGFGWDQNPWVIALTFSVHHQDVDELLAARAGT